MSFLRQKEVFGFQVPVDHALFVSGGQGSRDLNRVVQRLLLVDRSRSEPAAERLAFQKLKDGVGDPRLGPEVMNCQDVRMGERRDGPGLAFKTREGLGIGGDGLRQHLDRDIPAEPGVPRPIHLSHSA